MCQTFQIIFVTCAKDPDRDIQESNVIIIIEVYKKYSFMFNTNNYLTDNINKHLKVVMKK